MTYPIWSNVQRKYIQVAATTTDTSGGFTKWQQQQQTHLAASPFQTVKLMP
jgi:hypothetical protein